MISFIDCYIESPVNHSVNHFVQNSAIPSTYHMISQFGFESLLQETAPNAYIILGSAAYVSENRSWQKELLNFIIPKLESGVPVLGICYGHQLIASHYGSKVEFNTPKRTSYNEAREITVKKPFWKYNQGDTITLPYAHSQVITELHADFESLANSSRFENEIIRHKSLPFYGTQSHPEASLKFLKEDSSITTNFEPLLKDGMDFIKGFYLNTKD